jgi:hypothetical protein
MFTHLLMQNLNPISYPKLKASLFIFSLELKKNFQVVLKEKKHHRIFF